MNIGLHAEMYLQERICIYLVSFSVMQDGGWGDEEEDDTFEAEHTRGVGTSIYTSPELENDGKYDEKVPLMCS